MASGGLTVICEYFVQNDVDSKDQYKNIFIMPKKYASIEMVKQAEVLKAFPLRDREYVFRFQTNVRLAGGRTQKLWIDMAKNLDRPVPHIEGKIIIKALKLPVDVKRKVQIQRANSKPQVQRAQGESRQEPVKKAMTTSKSTPYADPMTSPDLKQNFRDSPADTKFG